MQRQPVAIVGSNISALVSAISCARQGLPVVMIGSRKHFGVFLVSESGTH